MKKLALICIFLTTVIDANATCNNVLRELLNKDFALSVEVILPSPEVGQTYKRRYKNFSAAVGAVLKGARLSFFA